MKPNNSFSKIDVITSLRGIAAAMVFLFHLICVSNNYISSKSLQDIFRFGKHGVDLFFVISGFVICFSMIKSSYNYTNFFTFFKKRLIRIEPPYLFVLVISIGLIFFRNIFIQPEQVNQIDVFQILLHIGYLVPFSDHQWLNIVFWTLAIEFQFYLIISLLIPLISKFKYARYFFYTLSLSLSYLIPLESHILFWLPVFITGMNLAFIFLKKISFIEFVIVFILTNTFGLIRYEFPIFIFTILPQIIIYFLPYFKNKTLNFLGEISYSLYLTHTLTAFTIINIGFRLPNNLIIKVSVVLSAIVITLLVSFMFYKYVEKPFLKIASNIKYR